MAHDPTFSNAPGDPVAAAAAQWVARRDRGLSAAEEAEFNAWCEADPRHRDALRRHYELWSALDVLQDCRPAAGGEPDPDLLAPAGDAKRHYLFPLVAVATLAAAAAVAIWIRPLGRPSQVSPSAAAAVASVRVIPGGQTRILADGTTVILDRGAELVPDFTPTERQVRLLRGEAHFTVRHATDRPFVVTVGSVYVRDVSTAFAVRRTDRSVRVLVTQGSVLVGRPALGAPVSVREGERADVDTTVPGAVPQVTRVSATDLDRMLAWRHEQLEFHDLPLRTVVAQFNRLNQTQIVLGDEAIANLHVAGRFRADNVQAFVRLLQQSFGVSAEYRTNAIVLRSPPR